MFQGLYLNVISFKDYILIIFPIFGKFRSSFILDSLNANYTFFYGPILYFTLFHSTRKLFLIFSQYWIFGVLVCFNIFGECS
jgi:hypothetical protein